MALVQTRAVVLRAYPYSDTSKILRLYTVDYGLKSVIAKGALRPRSRFGGMLEVFTEGTALFYLKEGRDLHTLSSFELLRSRHELAADLVRLSGASLLAELVLHAATEEPHRALFLALTRGWDALAAATTPREAAATTIAAGWHLVRLLGFAPELDRCATCGRPLAEDEPSGFDLAAGSVACRRCRPHGRTVAAATRRELRAMTRGHRPPTLTHWPTHRDLFRQFLAHHLTDDRGLRALPLFLQAAQEAQTTARPTE